MDASPDVLVEQIRAKRIAIDNDLELLRTRLQKVDPRQADLQRWGRIAAPAAAGVAVLWALARWRKPVRSLDDLLVTGLAELYEGEQQLVDALALMRDRAHHPELRQAFETHRVETRGHVDRLERVFRSIGAKPRTGRTSAGVAGIVAEGERMLKGVKDRAVRDAALIATAQRVEHVEIAAYGTVRTFAATLGYAPAADLLQQTLDEERRADGLLTKLANRGVNEESKK